MLAGIGDSGTASCRAGRSEVLRYLGYAGQKLDDSLANRIDDAIAHCERVSNPAWTYRVFPVVMGRHSIGLQGTTLVLTGGDIASHLEGARFCAVMAATAGMANERELRRLSLLNGLDGMIFDAAGSALAESVADACNSAIVADARRRGLFANGRYSPGYGDLPLDLQPGIMRVLAADRKLGLSVTESNLLIPAKSVTAFIGLFDSPQDDRRSCANCSLVLQCDLRKEGMTCYR